jgi:hypothetical protein
MGVDERSVKLLSFGGSEVKMYNRCACRVRMVQASRYTKKGVGFWFVQTFPLPPRWARYSSCSDQHSPLTSLPLRGECSKTIIAEREIIGKNLGTQNGAFYPPWPYSPVAALTEDSRSRPLIKLTKVL